MQAAVFQRYNLIARSLTQAVHDCQSQAVLLHASGENNVRTGTVKITQQVEQISSQLFTAVTPAGKLQLLLWTLKRRPDYATA